MLLAFEALMVMYRSLESQRNDLAHGCFGYAASDPDILFWIELKHHVHFMADHISKEAKGIQEPDSHAKLKKHLFVYRMKDLTLSRSRKFGSRLSTSIAICGALEPSLALNHFHGYVPCL